MIKAWFKRATPPGEDQPAPGRLAPGRRVYAVGDPHGCLDRLQALHALIAADLLARPVAQPLLIHLGDYIDRGPDSAGIVALLAGAGTALASVPVVNLLGNHEAMMLDALDHGGLAAETWLANGGTATLDSWGVPPYAQAPAWPDLLPALHVRFLRGLPRQHEVDGYVFVHAGLRPGVPMAEQTDEDRIWLREPFLSAREPVVADQAGSIVVHGHTPGRTPAVTPARIGVDTGAVMGGPLTAAVLEADRVCFLQS